MVLSFGHLFGLFATLAIFLAITVHAARSVHSAEGFSLSGRSAGPVMVSGSILGTCVAGSSTIGTAQMAYSYGISAWWFALGIGLALILMAVFYARPLRKSDLETLPQYLQQHYGRTAGVLASLISSTGILFSAVASALSGIALIALAFHLASWQAAGVIAALVIVSVLFGGLKGAGLSGLVKMAAIGAALLVAGLLSCLALAHLPDFGARFPASPWFNPFARGGPETAANLISLIVGTICTQTYIQAIFSASDSKTAARGTMIAALITIPVGLPCVAVGMFMRAAHPEIAPIFALPMYLTLYLPSWLGGVGLAGILFSVVGSIAGLALGIGTMMAGDIGSALFRIESGRRILWLNRATVLAVTLIAMAIALGNPNSQVLDWNYMSMALRGAGVFAPMALAIFWPKHLSARWAAASMGFSTFLAVLGRFVFKLPVNPLFTGLFVSLATIAAGLLISVGRTGRCDGNYTSPGE
jgi:solute:Na+ symporter, SSS family